MLAKIFSHHNDQTKLDNKLQPLRNLEMVMVTSEKQCKKLAQMVGLQAIMLHKPKEMRSCQ